MCIRQYIGLAAAGYKPGRTRIFSRAEHNGQQSVLVIDSSDGGKTGNSAYDYIAAGVNLVLEHPEYFYDYHLWIYEWDKS